MRSSRAAGLFTAALLVASVVSIVLVILIMRDQGWLIRFGPIRIRAQDELRPFVVAVTCAAILAILHRRHTAWRVFMLVLLAAFGAVGLIALARHAQSVMEVSDGAILELNTLQAMRGRLLIGPYSRFGWHHPGPLYLYLQVPWYLLSGYRTAGMQAGALAINLVAIGAIAWVVWRYASAPLAIASSLLLTVYVFRAADVLVSVWNPHITLLPSLAFLVLCAAMATGAVSLLPWTALVGSFLVQTHVAMVPLVASVGLVAFGAAVVSARRREGDGAGARLRRTVNRTAWVLVVLWLLPIAEELTRTPGNLTKLWRFFLVDQHQGQPFTMAFAAWSSTLSALFRSNFTLPAGLRFQVTAAWWPVLCAAGQVKMVAAAAGLAFKRARRFDAWLATLCLIATLAALWSTMRIAEAIFDHEVFWMSALGALNAAAIVGALAAAASSRRTETLSWRRGMAAACALAVSICAATGVRGMLGVLDRSADAADDRAVQTLVAGIRTYVSDVHVRRPLFRVHRSVWTTAAGALLQLDKVGLQFSVDDNTAVVFGDLLSANGSEDVELVVAGRDEQPALAARPGNRVIANTDGVFVDAVPLASSVQPRTSGP